MATKKERYQKFCLENEVPIFMNPWWLDAVCENNKWDCVLVEKGGKVIAAMPYMLKKKGLFTFIGMPKLTPYLGPWVVFQPNQNYTKRLSYEKKTYIELIKQLPKFDKYNQSFYPSFKNWLPFYWKKFQQTTRYTYTIDTAKKEDVFKEFQDKTRWEINKASKLLKIYVPDDIDDFYNLIIQTFKRQNMPTPYSYSFLKKLDDILDQHKSKMVLLAKDTKGFIHAGVYLIWDNNMIYYLIGGSNPDFRKSGAASMLIWKGIKYAIEHDKIFNFEGSMHESIEKNFRAFGAIQTPYFKITKYNSFLLKLKRLFNK
ncbi:MAG: GNAT family N-acetyltransferase [Calditrichaeota bacterium]|nr:MAG: GNAT family N-acetyltransferase [Calditrichota bacterium]MBL1205351.1 GNAT family N-acetyltransferase [Calditrichota bacterium]NOG45180.1 GNAT family N-acetyltransferase [Calditrichota bacterium]